MCHCADLRAFVDYRRSISIDNFKVLPREVLVMHEKKEEAKMSVLGRFQF